MSLSGYLCHSTAALDADNDSTHDMLNQWGHLMDELSRTEPVQTQSTGWVQCTNCAHSHYLSISIDGFLIPFNSSSGIADSCKVSASSPSPYAVVSPVTHGVWSIRFPHSISNGESMN
eukprot:Gb_28763 [translate_table: standard]